MSSRWLSSSISGLSSAVHTLAGSQAGSHPDADLADEDAHLANKSSGSRSKANSSHCQYFRSLVFHSSPRHDPFTEPPTRCCFPAASSNHARFAPSLTPPSKN